MLCNPYGALGEKIVAYVIQPMLLDMVCIEMVQEVFPEAVQFFIYRNPIEVSISLRRIEEILTQIKVMINLSNVASIVRLSLEFIGEHNTEYRAWTYPIHPEFQFGFRGACFTTYYYLEAPKRGINIHGVRYEDLITYEDNIIKNIFQVCQLPDSFIEKAKAAMKKDSQVKSPISRKNVRNAL